MSLGSRSSSSPTSAAAAAAAFAPSMFHVCNITVQYYIFVLVGRCVASPRRCCLAIVRTLQCKHPRCSTRFTTRGGRYLAAVPPPPPAGLSLFLSVCLPTSHTFPRHALYCTCTIRLKATAFVHVAGGEQGWGSYFSKGT